MKTLNFNEGWRVKRLGEDGEGKIVNIPHDAMIEEERGLDAAEESTRVGFYATITSIRRNFPFPKSIRTRS